MTAPAVARAFSFERDVLASLELLPLCVRRKLDLAQLKLSLQGWQALALADRRALAAMQVRAFEGVLRAAASRAGAGLSPIADAAPPAWRAPFVPDGVRARALELGARLDDRAWSGLDDDARFALVHLAKDRRRDDRMRLALVELGLLAG
jgi:hypothetical protein